MNERAQVTALRCATMIILALVLPAWLLAIPAMVLSIAAALAIVRRPQLARDALDALKALLTPP